MKANFQLIFFWFLITITDAAKVIKIFTDEAITRKKRDGLNFLKIREKISLTLCKVIKLIGL